MMSDGWSIQGNKNYMAISKGNLKIVFDVIIKTKRGKLFCVNIQRDFEIGASLIDVSKDKAHRLLGHSGEETTMSTGKALGWKLTGTMHRCESCQTAKAKQKAVPKVSSHVPATEPGRRFFIDLSKIQAPSGVKTASKANWLMIVDESTGLKFSSFYRTKNGMIEPTCVQFQKWKTMGTQLKNVRCDNAGENTALERRANGAQWNLQLEFEYTARATPQQNSLVETGFASMLNKARAMLAAARVPYDRRYQIAGEAIITATKLDGLVVIKVNGTVKTRYEHFGYQLPRFVKHMRTGDWSHG